jgi:hypothetical protein
VKPITLLVSMASMFTVGCGQATTIPSSAPVWTLPATEVPTTTSAPPVDVTNRVSIIVRSAVAESPASSTTSTTTIPGIDNARYPRLLTLAHQIGWPAEWLPTLDVIIHGESRGISGLTGSGAVGITQVEWVIWGDLANELGHSRADVRDNNAANLEVALAIAYIALDHYDHWCQPWYPSLGNYRKYC